MPMTQLTHLEIFRKLSNVSGSMTNGTENAVPVVFEKKLFKYLSDVTLINVYCQRYPTVYALQVQIG